MRDPTAFLAGTVVAAGFLLAVPGPAAAGSIEVAPTTIELSGSKVAVFYVTNRGDVPIIAQIQAFDWSQTDKGDRLDPSKALAFSPPMARLTPGEQQIVRLALKAEADMRTERTFRLIVSELPDPDAKAAQGIRVLLQFSVPVFMPAMPSAQSHLVWDATRDGSGLVLTAHNTGSRHAKLAGLALTASDGRRIAPDLATLTYILSGASHSWAIPSRDLKAGEALHIAGRDESDGAILDASLVVPQ